jgi:hypothetical protein
MKEIPFQYEVTKVLEEKGYEIPLDIGKANEVVDILKPTLACLDSTKKRRVVAQIFNYLAFDSGTNTHHSGKPDDRPVGWRKIPNKQKKGKIRRL